MKKVTKAGGSVILGLLFILLICNSVTAQDSKLFIVATDACYQNAQSWVDFLIKSEVSIQHVKPEDFDKFKTEKYLVLMFGLDESDTIKDIAKSVLSADEFQSLGTSGNENMFIKADVWQKGQYVIVFGGLDVEHAGLARKETREKWFNIFCNWFELEVSHEQLYGY